jgi:hypothetical protein
MTYQIVMHGRDGLVMASDDREALFPESTDYGEGNVTNALNKIRLDSTGRFAWAFAGSTPSLLASRYLEQRFEAAIDDKNLERILRDCGDLGWENGASGPGTSTIVLADGREKNIFRAVLASRSTVVSKIKDGRCFAGQTYSKASFFPIRFYSQEMSVSELAVLASYTLLMAAKFDPVLIGGLDVAIYRDSVGRFEFADVSLFQDRVSQLDNQIEMLFRGRPIG